MVNITTDRDPILPQIPKDTDSLEKVANWRKNHITILKNLHTTVYNDFTSFKNKITEIPVYANNTAQQEIFTDQVETQTDVYVKWLPIGGQKCH